MNIPAVEAGLKDAMENGVLAGYPLVDIKAKLMMEATMMSIHLKQPSKLPASVALKAAARKLNLLS